MLLTYNTILAKKSQLNSNTYLFHFNLLEPKEVDFMPGQYMILKVSSDKGPVSRLYSIASSSIVRNSFDLIIEIVLGGLASNYLLNLKENTEVIFQGPAGMFKLRKNDRTKIFMVTGTGIAPILSMIKSEFQINLFWGLKNYKDVYLLNELKQWSNETMKQFSFKICLSRETSLDSIPESDKKYFELGHVDICLEKQILDIKYSILNTEFYLCGGRNIVESLKQFLLNKNVSAGNIIFEKF